VLFNDGLKRGKEENEDESALRAGRPNSGAKEEVCNLKLLHDIDRHEALARSNLNRIIEQDLRRVWEQDPILSWRRRYTTGTRREEAKY
jgi:hypothetical protein